MGRTDYPPYLQVLLWPGQPFPDPSLCAVAGGAYLPAMDLLLRTILLDKMRIGILNALNSALLFGELLRRRRAKMDGKHQATL